MIELDRLKAILNKSSKEEVKFIRKAIVNFDLKNENNNNSLRLFDILTSNGDSDVSYIYDVIYSKTNKVALKKLLQRLTEKVLDNLITKDLLMLNILYDIKSKRVFDIKRKLFYYDILVSRGITNYALMILDQAISSAIKIEYYDYLIIALDKKLIKISLRQGINKYKKIIADIKFYSDCNSSFKDSQYLLRLYGANNEYRKKLLGKNEILKSIDKVKEDYKRTRSKSLKINLFYLEAIYNSLNEDYIKCKDNFKSLYVFLKLNGNVVFDSQTIDCILNIAESETMLYNFESSLDYLNKLTYQYSRNEFNAKLVMEMKFINYFYLGNIKNSIEYARALLSIGSLDKVSIFLHSKRYFYLASLFSINGLFLESNKLLSNCRPLDKDKDGWNIGIRILSIINNIELGKLIYVESQIENLRKHVSRVKSDNDFYYRFQLISRLLSYLCNNSYNYKVVFIKYELEFTKLRSIDLKYRWKLKSPEMILFHEWFESKVKNIPYDHADVMSRLKKANKVKRMK